jgi:hypothetical protein
MTTSVWATEKERERQRRRRAKNPEYFTNRDRAAIGTPEKTARTAVQNAIKTGKLTKPEACEHCCKTLPKAKLHGHHADYSKPLDVMWLCSICHTAEHAKAGTWPGAKLTREQVLEIRASNETGKALASKYAMDEKQIGRIRRGQAYKFY